MSESYFIYIIPIGFMLWNLFLTILVILNLKMHQVSKDLHEEAFSQLDILRRNK